MEDRAVGHAEKAGGEHEEEEVGKHRHHKRGAHQGHARSRVKDGERANASQVIGNRTAHGTQQRTSQGTEGRIGAGFHRGNPILRIEVDHERCAEPDKAAEADRVVKAEPVGVLLLEEIRVIGKLLRLHFHRRILGQPNVDSQDEQHGDQYNAEHVLPTVDRRETRSQQTVDDHPDVTRARQAHDQALHVGRIPAARLRQRHGEAGSRETEDKPHEERGLKRM